LSPNFENYFLMLAQFYKIRSKMFGAPKNLTAQNIKFSENNRTVVSRALLKGEAPESFTHGRE